MKQRTISAVVALIIFIPIFIIGGLTFNVAFYIVTLLGINEFMKLRDNKFPDFIRLISYLMITLIYFGNTLNSNLNFTIDYRLLAGLFSVILLPVVLYHNEKVYNIKDAFYLLGGLLFLGLSMSLFYLYRNIGLELLIYLFLITTITDSYAYFIGKLIGKNKLLEVISPKKTLEGTIGGSLVGTFIGTVYYLTFISSEMPLFQIIIITLFLSLVGQLGDLFFSAIKRTYKVKDFSNIMPGHGGILDRLDSIIFVMIAFTFFITII